MGSGTLLWKSMGSMEPVEPMLKQPLKIEVLWAEIDKLFLFLHNILKFCEKLLAWNNSNDFPQFYCGKTALKPWTREMGSLIKLINVLIYLTKMYLKFLMWKEKILCWVGFKYWRLYREHHYKPCGSRVSAHSNFLNINDIKRKKISYL